MTTKKPIRSTGRYLIVGLLTAAPLTVTWIILEFLFDNLSRVGRPWANALALGEGRETVDVTLLGQRYRQAPFRYQGKCWDVMQRRFAALPPTVRDRLDPLLRKTGCLAFLQ